MNKKVFYSFRKQIALMLVCSFIFMILATPILAADTGLAGLQQLLQNQSGSDDQQGAQMQQQGAQSTGQQPQVDVYQTPEPNIKILPGVYLAIAVAGKQFMVSVNSVGMINIPGVGDLYVSEKTPEKLAAELSTRLKQQVKVEVIPAFQGVSVLGEVNMQRNVGPGTLYSSVADAGGFKTESNFRITIFNNYTGKSRIYNYYNLLRGDYKDNPRTFPGDVIYVQKRGSWLFYDSLDPWLKIIGTIAVTIISYAQLRQLQQQSQ